MTKIESDKVHISHSPEAIFNFLGDFNNFEKLMPKEVTLWKSTHDECSFKIGGMAHLGMKIIEKKPFELIRIAKNGEAPFDFFLNCLIKESEQGTEVQLAFDAELNPMMKMMAVKPLTNFLNLLVQKMKDLPWNPNA